MNSFNSRDAWAAVAVERASERKMNGESSDALASDLAKADVSRLISFSQVVIGQLVGENCRTSNLAAGSLTTARRYNYDRNN